MSWAQKLKEAMIEADPEPSAPVPSVTTSSLPASAPYVMAPLPAPVAVPTDGFLTKLRSHLPPSSIDKFEATLASLSGVIPDTRMRLSAALSAIKITAGIEVAQLKDEYNSRLAALELQCGQFKTALDGQRSAEVATREAQIADVTSAIEAKNKEIQALSAKRETLNQEIAAAKTKLAGKQAEFDSAAATMRGEIQDAVSRLGFTA